MLSFIASIDNAVLQALYSVRSPFLVQSFIWVSELARWPAILGLAAIVALVLAYRNRWAIAAGLITSAYGGVIATGLIKEAVARPRPGADFAAYLEMTGSFPSSHAVLSIAFYGYLLWIVWEGLSSLQRKIAVYICGIIVFLEGFGRLYLGIHYLSDVLMGYLLGGALTYIGIFAARKLARAELGLA